MVSEGYRDWLRVQKTEPARWEVRLWEFLFRGKAG